MKILEAINFITTSSNAFTVQCDNSPVDYFLHGHDFIELVIVKTGYGINIINGKAKFITAGDFFVIRPNTLHYYRNIHNLELVNIIISLSDVFCHIKNIDILLSSIEKKAIEEKGYSNLQTEILTEVLQICDALSPHTAVCHIDEGIIALEITFLNLIVKLAQHSSVDKKNKESFIINKLTHSLNTPIDWDVFSSDIGIPKRSLYRVIKKRWNCNPSKLVMILRTVKAHEYIRNTEMTIAEIARLCGFSCASHLSHEYKKVFNTSPSFERFQP